MTLTLGTKQSFTPAHTHRCGLDYALFRPSLVGVGAGVDGWFGIRRETLTEHASTPALPGVRRLREGGREQAPGRAQAESWALPEPHPLPTQVAGRGFGNRVARAGEEGGGRTWPGGRSGRCPPRPLSFWRRPLSSGH